MHDIIQMSFLIFVTDVTFFLFVIHNSTLGTHRKRLFLTAGAIAFAMAICNIVIYTYQGTGEQLVLLNIFNAISYAISGPVVIPFVFLSSVIDKKVQYALLVLAAVNAVLSFSSIFNGCIFSYDENGNQTFGALSPVPFCLCAVYILVMLASAVLKFRLGHRGESRFIVVLCVAIAAATVMNTFFGYKFLISGMAVLSCVFYYLFFTTQILTRDALTNAFNRHSFYKDIQRMQNHRMSVISFDLNGLKQINDTYGHDAGDKLIKTLAECTFAVLPAKCTFYRMGGDEFEILYPNASREDTDKLCAALREKLQERGCSAAIGYAVYDREMDFDEVQKAADRMMYDNKAEMKRLIAAEK